MRLTLALTLLLAACSQENSTDSANFAGIYGHGDRDRLCLTGSDENLTIGVIAYGEGNANCSFKGRAAYVDGIAGPLLQVQPVGDEQCSFQIDLTEPALTLKASGPACDYYCGPGASFEGKAFVSLQAAGKVTDFAGDPLC